MSFIRPEVQASLMRWRELVIGAALDAIGVITVLGPTRANLIFGILLMGLGTVLMVIGIQRGRFRSEGGGVGVVEVDERQISYFGPDSGGIIAMEDLQSVAMVPPQTWELTDVRGARFRIPADAEGTEALFDAFSALPGMSTARLASVGRAKPVARTTVWEKPHNRLS